MTPAPVPGLVSVVVASYNHAAFLDRRIDSLLAQTYEQIEIIIIDDLSPDNSVQVLSKYADHPRVRLVLREENGGWVTVSNQGAELARGEFLLFANCDDACDPKMVEVLVAELAAHETAGLAYCRSLLVTGDDRALGDDFEDREPAFKRRCADTTLLTGEEMTRFLMHSCVIPNLSAALFRRRVFDAAGRLTQEYRVCCDWDLFFRIAERADVVYVPAPLNHFRQHARTIRSTTKERVVVEEYLRLLLGRLQRPDFAPMDRTRLRARVMLIWAEHVITPSSSGVRSLAYHLGRVASYDPAALAFALPAFVWRGAIVAGKALIGYRPKADR